MILRADAQGLRNFISRIAIKNNAQGTLLFVLFIAICIFEVAVVAVLSFEAVAPNSNIQSISDALWWAFVTVATVGYGDKYPVTLGGRVIAIMLMGVGIALFTVITGSLAEWFSGRQQLSFFDDDEDNLSTQESISQIRRLLLKQENDYNQMLTQMRKRLDELESELE